jgi:CubicO group peptidase (beta-lactamase class C family)
VFKDETMLKLMVQVVMVMGLFSGVVVAQDERFAEALSYSKSHNGHALLILEGGQVVLEDYHNDHSQNQLHIMASGTKSFGCALANLAIQDGLMTFDERVADTITEWQSDPEKSTITIRQVLSQTDGVEGGEAFLRGLRSTNKVETALEIPLVAPVGERFIYGPSHFYIFDEVLRRKLGGADTVDYLVERILDPIGANNFRMARDAANIPNWAAGMLMTARSWAKYGMLIEQDGRWGDEQLLDADLLQECFIGTTANPYYGLTFWLAYDSTQLPDLGIMAIQSPDPAEFTEPIVLGETQPQIIIAAGVLNQRLYIIPARDTVIVRFGRADDDFDDRELLRLLLVNE